MNPCMGCKHAVWARTAAGRLDASGMGRCVYFQNNPPPVPAAVSSFSNVPRLLRETLFIERPGGQRTGWPAGPCPTREDA